MCRIILVRESGWKEKEKQVKGELYVYFENKMLARTKSLELPWRNNQTNISCISTGKYQGIVHNSPKFNWCIWVKGVPDRSEVLIHSANYVGSMNPETGTPDLRGCIAPGEDYKDITGDGVVEIVNSQKALDNILDNFDEGEEMDVIVTSIDGL